MADPKTFTCARCKGTFTNAWSEEEARAEQARDYPEATDTIVLCDECYAEFKEWESAQSEAR